MNDRPPNGPRTLGRSDVYSLGCSLYRLLAGKTMYSGDSLMQILLAHRDQPIPPLKEARPDVPSQLDAVYQRMVAKRPEDRYQSMSEVVTALSSFREGVSAASDGHAATVTFITENKPDDKLAEFLHDITSRTETVQRQVDVQTGEAEPLPTTANKRPQPWWIYGILGGSAVLTLVFVVVFLNSDKTAGEPSPVAQAAKELQKPADTRTVPESSKSDHLREQAARTAELTAAASKERPEPARAEAQSAEQIKTPTSRDDRSDSENPPEMEQETPAKPEPPALEPTGEDCTAAALLAFASGDRLTADRFFDQAKASDGGDIGCRYTPEMMELCRIALELRAKGIIKF